VFENTAPAVCHDGEEIARPFGSPANIIGHSGYGRAGFARRNSKHVGRRGDGSGEFVREMILMAAHGTLSSPRGAVPDGAEWMRCSLDFLDVESNHEAETHRKG
jgi:hypothetical protein